MRVNRDQLGFTIFANLWIILVEGNFGKQGKIKTHFNLFFRKRVGTILENESTMIKLDLLFLPDYGLSWLRETLVRRVKSQHISIYFLGKS
tara:strand:- start:153 stop:425 length:273 start_codon:yes stop_codon:yes gene_type:complete